MCLFKHFPHMLLASMLFCLQTAAVADTKSTITNTGSLTIWVACGCGANTTWKSLSPGKSKDCSTQDIDVMCQMAEISTSGLKMDCIKDGGESCASCTANDPTIMPAIENPCSNSQSK